MESHNRDLLVLLKATSFQDGALEEHLECLHKVILQVENKDCFCLAHELATRLKITRKRRAIEKAASHRELKPFNFLINKN
jgi:hypothetical protein